jgi:hypothetical protein
MMNKEGVHRVTSQGALSPYAGSLARSARQPGLTAAPNLTQLPAIIRSALALIATIVSASSCLGLNWTNSLPASAAGT